jgi:hypothetical protein
MSIYKLIQLLEREYNCKFVDEHIYRKNYPNWDKSKIDALLCKKKIVQFYLSYCPTIA